MIKTMANNITPQNIMQELNNPKNWKRTSKKIYEVYMCKPGTGVKVQDKISGNPYVVNDTQAYVISGTIGDIDVIDARTLATNYAFIDNTPINGETIRKKANRDGLIDWTHLKTTPKNGEVVWAFHLPNSIQNFPVNTRNGGVYANKQGTKHGYGDFLVCADAGGQPNLNDIIVVNGMVFPTTYDLRAFPGMFPADVTKAEIVKPTASLLKQIVKDEPEVTKKKSEAAQSSLDTKEMFRKICDFVTSKTSKRVTIEIVESALKIRAFIALPGDIGSNRYTFWMMLEEEDNKHNTGSFISDGTNIKKLGEHRLNLNNSGEVKNLCAVLVKEINKFIKDREENTFNLNVQDLDEFITRLGNIFWDVFKFRLVLNSEKLNNGRVIYKGCIGSNEVKFEFEPYRLDNDKNRLVQTSLVINTEHVITIDDTTSTIINIDTNENEHALSKAYAEKLSHLCEIKNLEELRDKIIKGTGVPGLMPELDRNCCVLRMTKLVDNTSNIESVNIDTDLGNEYCIELRLSKLKHPKKIHFNVSKDTHLLIELIEEVFTNPDIVVQAIRGY